MSTSWTKQEDQQLIKCLERGLSKGWSETYLFQTISQKLKRDVEACVERWKVLRERQDRTTMSLRISQLEQVVAQQQEQLTKFKKDLRFYELLLLEEYHLLLKILGEDQQKIRIHRI